MHKLALACLAMTFSAMSPALSQQIGPEIRIGGGEATIGGVGIRNGKVALPTPDQIVDTVINTNPATMFLSDADKKNIKNAIVTVGFVATTVSDPLLGLVIVTVIQKDGQTHQVPIPAASVPPTGKTWSFAAHCIVQREGNQIVALFDNDPEHIKDVSEGDTLNLQAPVCLEYKKASVTAVTMKVTGRHHDDQGQPRHIFIGATS